MSAAKPIVIDAEPDQASVLLLCNEDMEMNDPHQNAVPANVTNDPPVLAKNKTVSAVARLDEILSPSTSPKTQADFSPVFDAPWVSNGQEKVDRIKPDAAWEPKVMVQTAPNKWRPISPKASLATPATSAVDVKLVSRRVKSGMRLDDSTMQPCRTRAGFQPYPRSGLKAPRTKQQVPAKAPEVQICEDMLKQEIEDFKDVYVDSFDEICSDLMEVWQIREIQTDAQDRLEHMHQTTCKRLEDVLEVFQYRGADMEKVERVGWLTILPLDDELALPITSTQPLIKTFRQDLDDRCKQFATSYKAMQVYRGKHAAYRAKAKTQDEFKDDHDLFEFELNGKPIVAVQDHSLKNSKSPDYEQNAEATMGMLASIVRRQSTVISTPTKPKAVIEGFEMTYDMLATFKAWRQCKGHDNEYADMGYGQLARLHFQLKRLKSVIEAKLLSLAEAGLY